MPCATGIGLRRPVSGCESLLQFPSGPLTRPSATLSPGGQKAPIAAHRKESSRQPDLNVAPSPGRLSQVTARRARHDLANDRQPQAGAAGRLWPGTRKNFSNTCGTAPAGCPRRCRRPRARRRRASAAARRVIRAAALGVGQRVVQQIAQRRARMRGDRRRPAAVPPARPRRTSTPLSWARGRTASAAVCEQLAGACGANSSCPAALLDAGQVQQVVDHRQQPLGVLARRPAAARPAWASAGRPPPPAAGGRPAGCWSAASSARG